MNEWLTLKEASKLTGKTAHSIRMRIKRAQDKGEPVKVRTETRNGHDFLLLHQDEVHRLTSHGESVNAHMGTSQEGSREHYRESSQYHSHDPSRSASHKETIVTDAWGSSPDVPGNGKNRSASQDISQDTSQHPSRSDSHFHRPSQEGSQGIPVNFEEIIGSVVKNILQETLEGQKLQLMKPLEQQALFIAGKLTQENLDLRERFETVLRENEQLREQLKLLPAPVEEISAQLAKIESISLEREALEKSLQEVQEAHSGVLTQVEELSSHVEALKASEAILRQETDHERQARKQAEEKYKKELEAREAAELARLEAEEKAAQEDRDREALAVKLADEERHRQESLKEQEALRQQMAAEVQEKARLAAEHQATLDRLQEEERMRKAMAEQLAEAQLPWYKKLFRKKS